MLFRTAQEIQGFVAARAEKRWHRLSIRFWLRYAYDGATAALVPAEPDDQGLLFGYRWIHYSETRKNTGKLDARRKCMKGKEMGENGGNGGLTRGGPPAMPEPGGWPFIVARFAAG